METPKLLKMVLRRKSGVNVILSCGEMKNSSQRAKMFSSLSAKDFSTLSGKVCGSYCSSRVRAYSGNPGGKPIACDLEDVPIPEMHFSSFLWSREHLYKDNVSLVDGVTGRSLTLSESHSLSRCFGSALAKRGAGKGDVIGMVMPNCPEFPLVLAGAAGIGATITTINPVYTRGEISAQLRDSKAKWVVTVKEMVDKIDVEGVEMIVAGEGLDGNMVRLEDMFKDQGDQYPAQPSCDPGTDVMLLPYSSGTTGKPKGVMLTHRNLVANMAQMDHPSLDFMAREEVTVNILPMYHAYALNVTMTNMIWNGGKIVTLPKFEPQQFLQALVKYRPTILHLAPPLVGFLANHPSVTSDHVSSIHTITVAAAPLGTALIQQLLQKAPHIEFREAYGMTELSPVTTYSRIGRVVHGSIGQLVPNTKMKVVDVETGATLGEGQRGELCFQGPQVMAGYLNNPSSTANTIVDGWLHSGDIGYFDQHENVYIVDRLKELIKVKGLQVAPAELEDVIRRIAGVKDVAVIGVPDARSGEVPRAYVVREGVDVDEKTIFSGVARDLARHKHLDGGVEFVQEIPKSAAGKILRKHLREAHKNK